LESGQTTPARSTRAARREPPAWRARFFDPWGLGEETKPFFLTSEFWVAVITAVALFIGSSAWNFDAPLMWTLVTVVASAYVLSRGLAKSGARYLDQDRRR
jgi:hypothetical protein